MVGKRVLVTGATGGLGRILVETLCATGHEVVATGRNVVIGAGLENCHFIPADLAEDALEPMFEGVDTVFHLAALSTPWGKYRDFERTNVLATERLLEAAEAQRVRAFVFASTPSIYTDAKDQLNITESTPLPPRFANDYAATKFEAERLVRTHAGEMQTVALRPRAIVSPFDTALLPRLIRAGQKGRMPLPANGDALIELSDARDVAGAFMAAAKRASAIQGRAFNISGGSPRRFKDLASHVFKALGRDVRFVRVNAKFAATMGAILEGLAKCIPGQPEPPITRYSAMAIGWSQTFDLSAAKTALDWTPCIAPEQAIDWALGLRSHG